MIDEASLQSMVRKVENEEERSTAEAASTIIATRGKKWKIRGRRPGGTHHRRASIRIIRFIGWILTWFLRLNQQGKRVMWSEWSRSFTERKITSVVQFDD
jgi:hypothetical protein